MYRRILGFFGGAVPESSEENKDLSEEGDNQENNEAGSKDSETNTMSLVKQESALRELVQNLEIELKERIQESEGYKTRLLLVEKELGVLKEMSKSQPAKMSTGVGDSNVHTASEQKFKERNADKLSNANTKLQDALNKTNELLKDKTELCNNQEKQNLALTNQVASLKEVVAITKDLLNIRNMEVKHLQNDVDGMEGKIAEEKQRHNLMIVKMDEAVKLNSDLKAEYETQLKIFQNLKSKYEDKVALLTKENAKLEGQIAKSAEEPAPDDSVQVASDIAHQ